MARFDEPDFTRRVGLLREALGEEGLGGLLVFAPRNMAYLSGFTGGEGALFVTNERTVVLSDFRYRVQVKEEAPWADYVEIEEKLSDVLPRLLTSCDGVVGIEPDFLTLAQWRALEPALVDAETRVADGMVERLRMVKEPGEVDAIREASHILAGVFQELAGMKVVGRSEADVALDLETWVRRHGSGTVPFEYIVAAGPRGAMPHGLPSRASIEAGSLVVVDIGASVDGYASDMTRTFATGRLGDEELEIYSLVQRAQEAGRVAARPGASCADVDAEARRIIAAGGYGDFFKHSLGHGVGLEVHEGPRVSRLSADTLASGMVVTVEPGIYLAGKGGVRIEDTVVVTERGCEVLTDFERGLVTLG
jgi:Xaa-Pro aminopeptidase